MSLISDLLHFREEAARRENVESFRVLSKANLDAIAFARPKNKEELTAIKGIKEAKYRKYGQGILAIVAAHTVGEYSREEEEVSFTKETSEPEEVTLSVNDFLESINTELSGFAARIRGEISDFNIWQERVVFFSLKDSKADSILKCNISYQNYLLSGTKFAIGDEIIAEGYPKIYKPRGELSFQVMTIELFGEGALKKAYDELYAKLALEGAFDPDQKRPLPKYPERIALITSRDGAALGDFQMNVGRFGLKIDLYPSGVEGNRAIHDLIAAVKYFKKEAKNYDVLLIVRGGGGLESLQAFNNEALVNEIRTMPIPTLCGIGHEKDITLASLVADRMESTPTACALAVTSHWEEARHLLTTSVNILPNLFERRLFTQKEEISNMHTFLFESLHVLKASVSTLEQRFFEVLHVSLQRVQAMERELSERGGQLRQRLESVLKQAEEGLTTAQKRLEQYNPTNILRLGYSILKHQNRVLKSTEALKKDDILDIQLEKGMIVARIEKII